MEVSVGMTNHNSTGAACKGTKHGLSLMIRSSAAGFYLNYGCIHSRVFKIASVLVYLDNVARYIEHSNHSIV